MNISWFDFWKSNINYIIFCESWISWKPSVCQVIKLRCSKPLKSCLNHSENRKLQAHLSYVTGPLSLHSSITLGIVITINTEFADSDFSLKNGAVSGDEKQNLKCVYSKTEMIFIYYLLT